MSNKHPVTFNEPSFEKFKDRIEQNVKDCDGVIHNYGIKFPEWELTLLFESMEQIKESLGVEPTTKE